MIFHVRAILTNNFTGRTCSTVSYPDTTTTGSADQLEHCADTGRAREPVKPRIETTVAQKLILSDDRPSLASGIFSRSDSKTQTQYLTKSTPPDEFYFQLNVALLIDFLQGGIKRPLLNICPKFKRRVLNNPSVRDFTE
jgi:hypothetical protein